MPYQTTYYFPVIGSDVPTADYTLTSALATANLDQPVMSPDTAFVTVTDQDGFTVRTYSIIYRDVVGTFDPVLQAAIIAYPNPFSDCLTVQLPQADAFTGRIYSVDGRVATGEFTVRNGHSLDVSQLTQGAYVLVVRSADGRTARLKLMVE